MQIKVSQILRSEFFKDSLWALLGSVVLRGATLVSSVILAHVLQKTTFGEFNSLKNTLTTLAIFTTFGLGYTSTKFVADYIQKELKHPANLVRHIYLITFLFSATIASLLFVFAPEISQGYYKNTEFILEIRLLSFWIIITAVSTAQNGIIAGLGIFKKLSAVNVVMGAATLVFLPLLAYLYGLLGACIALLIIQTLNCALNALLVSRELRILSVTRNDTVSNISVLTIITFSLPLTLIEAIFSIFLWLNYYMLQNYQNYDEVALYSAAMQWYIVLLFIPSVLRNVILSHFSKEVNASKAAVLKNALSICVVTTVLPATIIFFTAPYIVRLYGETFAPLSNVLRIIAFIPVFSSVINVMEQYLFSIAKNWLVFILCLVKDALTFLLFVLAIFTFHISKGAMYLSGAYLIMNIVICLVYAILYIYTNIFNRHLQLST